MDQRLQFLLLRLHVDRVAFQVVVLLFLELLVQLFVQLLDDVVKLLPGILDLGVILCPPACAYLLTGVTK